jgi:predicted RND superfamily exporter protein
MRLEDAFERAARASVRRPLVVVAVALAVGVVALWSAAGRLTLRTSNLDLVDPDLVPVRDFLDFANEFGTPNALVVVLENPDASPGADESRLTAAVDRVGPLLREVPGVRGVLDCKPLDPDIDAALQVDRYFTSFDRSRFYVFVQPDDPASRVETIAPLVDGVREAVDRSGVEASGVKVGYTGLPRYALDDRDAVRHDLSRLSVASLVLVLLVFLVGFGSVRRPLVAVLALLAAITATLGVASWYPGHLTLLSAFFASVLLGLGIDSGIHVVDRVEEEIASGSPLELAVPRAVGAIGRSLATSAATTAALFSAMLFCGFRGFEELGVISAIGVILCLVAMVTLLPALLVLSSSGARVRPRARRLSDRLASLQSPAAAAVTTLVVLVAACFGGPRFDTDYLNLQPRGSDAVRLEREMVAESPYSTQFAAFSVGSREEVVELVERLWDEPTVDATRSILETGVETALQGPPTASTEALRHMLIGSSGRQAVYAYPAGDIWAAEPQRAFVDSMRAVDPQVTGMPVLGRFMVERSQRALLRTAVLGSLALVVCVWADFRRTLPSLLALMPVALTVPAVLAVMRMTGIAFNPLNVMALPVVLGIAVDDGIHLVHRFVRERGDARATLTGTGRGVVITSLTTIASFGALSFSEHPGLAGFARIIVLGVGFALIFSLFLLPPLMGVSKRHLLARAARKTAPVEAAPAREPARSSGRHGRRARRSAKVLATLLVLAAPLRAGVRSDPLPQEAAIARLEAELAGGGSRAGARFELLRALYLQAYYLTEDGGEQAEIYQHMVELAADALAAAESAATCGHARMAPGGPSERCTATSAELVAAHFWSAVSWGLWGMSHSRMRAGAAGVATKIRRHAERVIELDPAFADGGGHRLLGRLHTATPKIPLFTGWIDRELGVELLETACRTSSADPRNLLFLAEALLRFRPAERERALRLLEDVAAREPAPGRRAEDLEAIGQARDLLARETAR